jgi:hypothetical protein
MHNTFTYRHSDLPPVPPATQAEIVALDVHIADLILKCQGNYRALEQLAEILDNCLDSCQLNLNSIRIIPDDSPQPPAVGLKDLPLNEKRLIYSCSFTGSVLLNMLADALGTKPEYLAEDVATQALVRCKPVADSDVEEFIDFIVLEAQQAKGNYIFTRLDK